VPNKSTDVTPHSFDPMSIPGLSSKAREAVKNVFEAMSDWRTEAADDSERNTKRVIEKMAAAAAALGWPEQIVEAARVQLQSIAEMQIQTMDRMADAWEEQLKSPNPMTSSPAAMLSKLKTPPGFGAAAANPFQLWIQSTQQWQQFWTDAMTSFWNQGAVAAGRRPGTGT
jgi:hypothetical protein